MRRKTTEIKILASSMLGIQVSVEKNAALICGIFHFSDVTTTHNMANFRVAG